MGHPRFGKVSPSGGPPVSERVPSLKGLGFIYNVYLGLTACPERSRRDRGYDFPPSGLRIVVSHPFAKAAKGWGTRRLFNKRWQSDKVLAGEVAIAQESVQGREIAIVTCLLRVEDTRSSHPSKRSLGGAPGLCAYRFSQSILLFFIQSIIRKPVDPTDQHYEQKYARH